MMLGILMSFKDTEPTWRHYTVVSNATFVIAIAATAEVVDIAVVICEHIGVGLTLTTFADFAGPFASAFAFTFEGTFASTFALFHVWLDIGSVIDLVMTKAALVTIVAIASSHEMMAL